jgi:hypothetical protein
MHDDEDTDNLDEANVEVYARKSMALLDRVQTSRLNYSLTITSRSIPMNDTMN